VSFRKEAAPKKGLGEGESEKTRKEGRKEWCLRSQKSGSVQKGNSPPLSLGGKGDAEQGCCPKKKKKEEGRGKKEKKEAAKKEKTTGPRPNDRFSLRSKKKTSGMGENEAQEVTHKTTNSGGGKRKDALTARQGYVGDLKIRLRPNQVQRCLIFSTRSGERGNLGKGKSHEFECREGEK